MWTLLACFKGAMQGKGLILVKNEPSAVCRILTSVFGRSYIDQYNFSTNMGQLKIKAGLIITLKKCNIMIALNSFHTLFLYVIHYSYSGTSII